MARKKKVSGEEVNRQLRAKLKTMKVGEFGKVKVGGRPYMLKKAAPRTASPGLVGENVEKRAKTILPKGRIRRDQIEFAPLKKAKARSIISPELRKIKFKKK